MITIDSAISALKFAKERIGGDKALILSLSDSELEDCNIDDIRITNDRTGKYVEIRVAHPALIEKKPKQPERVMTNEEKLARPNGICTSIANNGVENAAIIKVILEAYQNSPDGEMESSPRASEKWEYVDGCPTNFTDYRYRLLK